MAFLSTDVRGGCPGRKRCRDFAGVRGILRAFADREDTPDFAARVDDETRESAARNALTVWMAPDAVRRVAGAAG
jgi:hypothetical protein